MRREHFKIGLIEIGIGIIIYLSTFELSSLLISSNTKILFIFLIRLISYILIVVGLITAIMELLPEDKKIRFGKKSKVNK
jgi:hypothetical protein